MMSSLFLMLYKVLVVEYNEGRKLFGLFIVGDL